MIADPAAVMERNGLEWLQFQAVDLGRALALEVDDVAGAVRIALDQGMAARYPQIIEIDPHAGYSADVEIASLDLADASVRPSWMISSVGPWVGDHSWFDLLDLAQSTGEQQHRDPTYHRSRATTHTVGQAFQPDSPMSGWKA